MEIRDVRFRQTAPAGIQFVCRVLCRLSKADPRFWLVRSGAPGAIAAKGEESGACASGAASATSLVLFDGLSGVLVTFGTGATGNG